MIFRENRIDTNRGNFLVLSVLKHRYPNIFGASQLSKAQSILSKPLEPYSIPSADEKLCMSRLITYASDEGKSFPMHIGAEYSDEVRNTMAVFLVRFLKLPTNQNEKHFLFFSCASIYATTTLHTAPSCLASFSPCRGTFPPSTDSCSPKPTPEVADGVTLCLDFSEMVFSHFFILTAY